MENEKVHLQSSKCTPHIEGRWSSCKCRDENIGKRKELLLHFYHQMYSFQVVTLQEQVENVWRRKKKFQQPFNSWEFHIADDWVLGRRESFPFLSFDATRVDILV